MPRKKQETKGRYGTGKELSPDVQLLLAEISSEPVPERLLELARQLQAALNDKARVAS